MLPVVGVYINPEYLSNLSLMHAAANVTFMQTITCRSANVAIQ